MASRATELRSTRSTYLRKLPDDDATGLTNGPFADRGTAFSGFYASPSVPRAATTALYLQEAGDTSVISVNDIYQGQLGDCFLLASIGEIALWHPSAIMNMISANPDGTETVTLYLAASGQLPTYSTTSFNPTGVTINNTFSSNAVNNNETQDVVNGVKEIWVQVLEKAVATLGGGYSSIASGGSPVIAMKELAGQQAIWISPDALTLQTLKADAAAGDLIVMDTPAAGVLPYNLVNNHAYMFESVTVVNGTPMVQLGNPWGSNQPQAIPLPQLSSSIIEVDIGQFVDSNLITGGSGDDNRTLIAPVTNASVDLGTGKDTLILANGTNSATVANTETIVGGTGTDTVTFAGALVNGSVDLGGGSDTLTLANLTNRVSVANTETVFGGSGNDTIILTGSAAQSVIGGAGMNFITGNSAADRFVFDQNGYGDITWLTNFDSAKGDTIALDTTGHSTFLSDTYDLGGAALALGTNLADVGDWAARIATTLNNGGNGGFLYEQDTGELFYSANGSFADGGTQIGIVTSNGSTPWTFDANSFVQV